MTKLMYAWHHPDIEESIYPEVIHISPIQGRFKTMCTEKIPKKERRTQMDETPPQCPVCQACIDAIHKPIIDAATTVLTKNPGMDLIELTNLVCSSTEHSPTPSLIDELMPKICSKAENTVLGGMG